MDKLAFKPFTTAVENQFNAMCNDPSVVLARVAINIDELWDLYLSAYPQEFNGIFRERRNYDCNCCKNFIRRVGNLVAIKDGKLQTVWDVKVEGYFQQVADTLSEYIKVARIDNLYATSEKIAGSLSNNDTLEPTIKWDHFYAKVPDAYVLSTTEIGTKLGDFRGNKDVFHRSMKDFTLDAAETVLELIDQDLYKGPEFRATVVSFIECKKEFDQLTIDQQELFSWSKSAKLKGAGRFRNTVIGTLIEDISNGVALEKAVASFEQKVAPTNYKRTSAPITPAMIKLAQAKIVELGLESSLERRFATKNDIKVTDVLFSSVHEKPTDVFASLIQETTRQNTKIDKVETVTIDKFINDIVPHAAKIEVLLENRLKNNLVSVLAPEHTSAENMFKWDNKFSWAYNGDLTDTIKERVKAAGGNVEGDLRVSLAWYNSDDLDLSCIEPNGKTIYYHNKRSTNGGHLDLDMNGIDKHSDNEPVENLIYADRNKMAKGDYRFVVNQYSKRKNTDVGFDLQIEFDGKTQIFSHPQMFNSKEAVFIVNWDGKNFTLKNVWDGLIAGATSTQDIWGISTNEFVPVSMIMNSPNYWGENKSGNKHTFFILEGCKNDEPARGFFNEYLKNELNEHRKVFEVLGAKTKAVPDLTQDQVSGIGFSETLRNEFTVKVTGKTHRVFKVTV